MSYSNGRSTLQDDNIPFADFEEETEEKISNLAEKTGRILITGGSGYLGSVITDMLVNRGFNVTVLDNLSYSQNTLFNLIYKKNFRFLFGDVTNASFMQRLVSENFFDYIIPLAAIVGFPVSEQKPELTWLVNHTSIREMLKHTDKKTRILYPCSNSGYGFCSETGNPTMAASGMI